MKKLALLLGSILASLLLAEVVLRLSGRFPSQTLRTVDAATYEKIPGMFSPGQDFIDRSIPELAHRIHINALGLRGNEIASPKKARRILFIGDSYTFGTFVNEEETLPALTQKLLGANYEILNGGIPGSTITDQRVFLKRLMALKPDLVVLVYCENDLEDLLSPVPLYQSIEQNRRLKSGWFAPIYARIRDTCLFNILLAVRNAKNPFGILTKVVAKDPTTEWNEPSSEILGRYSSEVAAMRDDLFQSGIPLIVTAYPTNLSVSAIEPYGTIPLVKQSLKEVGIEVLDFTPGLKAAKLPINRLYLLPYDGHASAKANQIAAEILAPRISTQN